MSNTFVLTSENDPRRIEYWNTCCGELTFEKREQLRKKFINSLSSQKEDKFENYSQFETIRDLISESPTEIVIYINESGIYIESDHDLRREIDLKDPQGLSAETAPVFLNKLQELIG